MYYIVNIRAIHTKITATLPQIAKFVKPDDNELSMHK